MADTIYCYPGTDTLINKLGIKDPQKLQEIERRLTAVRLLELLENPIEGDFNMNHLKRIHQYLFQDLYDWAGKIRSVDIAKGNMFCKVQYIMIIADEIFGRLRADHYLNGLSQEQFISKLAYYFSEINALHPFREGNGRTQREFIRCLALQNGYCIHFSRVDKTEMLEASKASFLCDYSKMEMVFKQCLDHI